MPGHAAHPRWVTLGDPEPPGPCGACPTSDVVVHGALRRGHRRDAKGQRQQKQRDNRPTLTWYKHFSPSTPNPTDGQPTPHFTSSPPSKGEHLHTPGSTTRHTPSALMAPPPYTRLVILRTTKGGRVRGPTPPTHPPTHPPSIRLEITSTRGCQIKRRRVRRIPPPPPLFGGHSRSIPQGMILDVQLLVK